MTHGDVLRLFMVNWVFGERNAAVVVIENRDWSVLGPVQGGGHQEGVEAKSPALQHPPMPCIPPSVVQTTTVGCQRLFQATTPP